MKFYTARRKSDGKFYWPPDIYKPSSDWMDKPCLNFLFDKPCKIELDDGTELESVEMELTWDAPKDVRPSVGDHPHGGRYWIPWDPTVGPMGLKCDLWPECCRDEAAGTIMVMISEAEYSELASRIDNDYKAYDAAAMKLVEDGNHLRFQILKWTAEPEWEAVKK
jgi:hypothetical protein